MRNMHKKVKYGFTLAEALLTMIILGVIMSFVLPSLNATKPSESKLLYKKTFFTVSEAVMAVINNADYYDQDEYDILKAPKDANSENFCQYLANYLNTVGQIDCSGDTGSLKLANGVKINNIPKKPGSCVGEVTPFENVCTLFVSTKGETVTSVANDRDCKKTTSYKINIAENGKIFTENEWTCENSILETGSRVQQSNE